MFNKKVDRLINEFHIKQIALINLIESNKITFANKRKDNTFTQIEKKKILDKYGALL